MSRKPVIKTAAGTFSLEGIETLGAAIKQCTQLLMKGESISLIAQDGRRSRTQELLVADRAAAVAGLWLDLQPLMMAADYGDVIKDNVKISMKECWETRFYDRVRQNVFGTPVLSRDHWVEDSGRN